MSSIQFGVPSLELDTHNSLLEKNMTNLAGNFYDDAIKSFRKYKLLAERAMEQVSDEEFFDQIDKESNSIALIVKHISGNQHSRWIDFLTTDGEKPERDWLSSIQE